MINLKIELEKIESDLTVISADVFLIGQKMSSNSFHQFKEKVLFPLKSLVSYCENIQDQIEFNALIKEIK